MKKIKIFLLAALFIVAAGCEDFLDINRNPNRPAEPSIQKLLPGIEATIGDIFSLEFGSVGYAAAVFSHQISTRQPEYDNYGILGSSYAVNAYWPDFYADVLQDVDLLISLGEESDNLQYAGIGKVLKAYVFSTLVDLYGDVPFSEANVKGNINPVFDDQKEIYKGVFTLLEDGLVDLANKESENSKKPAGDDIIYGGSTAKWAKAARTIQLKLYTQVRLTDLYDQAKVDALLGAPDDLIASWAESFNIPYGKSAAPEDRNPGFTSEYGGGQISNYISPWFYEIMTGENPNIFTNIKDPRIPYYFVNQYSEDASAKPEYKNDEFVSIYFGSVGLNRDAAGRDRFTMMGIYPVGGKYDDGSPSEKALGTGDGTGAAPVRLLTYADRLYLEAELIAVNKATGTLGEVVEKAIKASITQVDQVVTKVASAQKDIPKLASDSAAIKYVAAIMGVFDAESSDARKLEIIMTQKWISSWGTAHDQYTDYRRTGYPIIFDPENPNMAPDGKVSGGPDGVGPVPVQRTREYPLSWPWSLDELTLNVNAPTTQKTISTYRVFWDIDN